MSLTVKMYLPVFIISAIAIILEIIVAVKARDKKIELLISVCLVGIIVIFIAFLIIDTENRNALSKVAEGLEKKSIVYDYVDENDYEIIIPDEENLEYIYQDYFGTFYLVRCENISIHGIKYTREKLTSKKENGVIIASQ